MARWARARPLRVSAPSFFAMSGDQPSELNSGCTWQYPNYTVSQQLEDKCGYQSSTTKHQALRSRWNSSQISSRKLPYSRLPTRLEPLTSVLRLSSNNGQDLANTQFLWALAEFLCQQPLLPGPGNAEQLSLRSECCPGQNTGRWTMEMVGNGNLHVRRYECDSGSSKGTRS